MTLALVTALVFVGLFLRQGAPVGATVSLLAGAWLMWRAWRRCARDLERGEGLIASGAFAPPTP